MGKSVGVKILVGVDSHGKWVAVGGWTQSVDDLKEATGLEDDVVAWYWVTADLAVPARTIPVVKGSSDDAPAD